MSAVALVPALNEAERIAATVTAIATVPGIDRVLVIDDGSTDDTARRACAAGAEVLSLQANAGKGRALAAGLDALDDDVDIVLFLDADLGPTATEAAALLAPVRAGEADMAIATLPRPPRSGGIGLVKGLARWGIRRLGGFDATAPLSGQRALSRAAWQSALPFPSGFGIEVALTVRVCRAGLRVREVPTTMQHAVTGRDLAGFRHRGRQFVAVAFALLRLALERQSAGVIGG